MYDHPYDVVDHIKWNKLPQPPSPEIIITFDTPSTKEQDTRSMHMHRMMAEIAQNQNPQQSSIIMPPMSDALNAFLSQQSHILIVISPYDAEFSVSDIQCLPPFDSTQIKQQLNVQTTEQKAFGTKFPKTIIVLNSKNQHCNLLILQRIIQTQAGGNGNLFAFDVKLVTSMMQMNTLIDQIKMQQHRMEIDIVIQMKNNSEITVNTSRSRMNEKEKRKIKETHNNNKSYNLFVLDYTI